MCNLQKKKKKKKTSVSICTKNLIKWLIGISVIYTTPIFIILLTRNCKRSKNNSNILHFFLPFLNKHLTVCYNSTSKHMTNFRLWASVAYSWLPLEKFICILKVFSLHHISGTKDIALPTNHVQFAKKKRKKKESVSICTKELIK